MKLKENINYTDFIMQVRKCRGEVFFCTADGDLLNLKSVLSEYLFITAALGSELLKNGTLVCKEPEDFSFLSNYTQEEF